MPDFSRAEAEVEALQSIYGSDCNFEVLDSADTLRVCLEFIENDLKIELAFNDDYPKSNLTIALQSSCLQKAIVASIIAAANEEVSKCCHMYPDTEHAMQAVQVILDKVAEAKAAAVLSEAGRAQAAPVDRTFKMVMVWFHHIMSPVKRSHIVDWSSELALSGICKVGFPGALLAVGPSQAMTAFIARLKGLQWQAMVVRHEDVLDHSTGVWLASCIASYLERGQHGAVVLVEDMSSLSAICRHVDQQAQSEQHTAGATGIAELGMEQAFRQAIMRL